MNVLPVARTSLAAHPSIPQIQEALLALSPDSAGGPFGLRPQHIQKAVNSSYRSELARALREVVGKLFRDQVPGPIVSWITSASLTALKKKNGRVDSRRDLASVAKEMNPSHNMQLGFGTPSGCETVVHSVCRCLGRFNHMDWSCLFREIRRVARPGNIQRRLLHQRQLCPLRSGEDPEQKRSRIRRLPGSKEPLQRATPGHTRQGHQDIGAFFLGAFLEGFLPCREVRVHPG